MRCSFLAPHLEREMPSRKKAKGKARKAAKQAGAKEAEAANAKEESQTLVANQRQKGGLDAHIQWP